MNCHGNNNNNHKGGSPRKHLLHMLICCGLPLLIITALPFMRFLSPALKTSLATIAPFICPIMMIFMIPMMFKNMSRKDGCCSNSRENLPSENKAEN
jgi:EamA domain-containing membrane protein RarD